MKKKPCFPYTPKTNISLDFVKNNHIYEDSWAPSKNLGYFTVNHLSFQGSNRKKISTKTWYHPQIGASLQSKCLSGRRFDDQSGESSGIVSFTYMCVCVFIYSILYVCVCDCVCVNSPSSPPWIRSQPWHFAGPEYARRNLGILATSLGKFIRPAFFVELSIDLRSVWYPLMLWTSLLSKFPCWENSHRMGQWPVGWTKDFGNEFSYDTTDLELFEAETNDHKDHSFRNHIHLAPLAIEKNPPLM